MNATGISKTVSGSLAFYKPDKAADDFSMKFQTDEKGFQKIQLPHLAHGYWKVSATYTVDGKNCAIEKKIFIQ
jgi:hypothetical protein